MFSALGRGDAALNAIKLEALDRSQATIEFEPDGSIITANDNFLRVMGYTLDEVVGRHHSIFVSAAERDTTAYRDFWQSLRRGEFRTAQFKRVTKTGGDVWTQATYLPLANKAGQVFRVMKFATDVSDTVRAAADAQGQLDAINRSQAVIQFELDGTIITANENFLKTMGYTAREIEGRHHRMFVDPIERETKEYRDFWKSLSERVFLHRECRRIAKSGADVWIQASYHPIFDTTGKPFKVVKFASEITDTVKDRERHAKAQEAMRELADLATGISEATAEAARASKAAQEASSNVESVAAAAEQFAASIGEINGQVTSAADISRRAVEQAQSTNHTISNLSEAARQIGQVVALISDIADQTNLLALNATIEAARAGEAGRGFAVVASEVKSLAGQSAKATEQITSQIEAIHGATENAVQAINEITSVIDQINAISTTIASAVEEQSGATRHISSNMTAAADGVNAITDSVGVISKLTANVDAAAQRAQAASGDLA